MPGGGTHPRLISTGDFTLLCTVLTLEAAHCSFMARLSFLLELMRSEARVVVSVGDMKGVPDPSTLQQLADGSDFPVITYSYCVTYEFVEGEELDDGSITEVCA